MKTRIIRAGVAALMALTAGRAAAQDILHYRAEAAGDAPQAGISVVALDPVSMGAAVTGAPYSAEAVTEVSQTLADGNRIERRTSATIARSGDGRIRREQNGFAVGAFVAENTQPIVTITDPTSGVHITLNHDLKVAFRMRPGWITSADAPPDGAAVSVSVGPFGSRTGGVAIGQRQAFGSNRRGMPPPPPPPPGTFEDRVIAVEPTAAGMPWNANYKTEQLEPRAIEGLEAEGTRTTMTIPAGAVGNALPIEVTNERWFSPELQIVLMTRRSDPRFGETTYRLTNIVRAEPAAELFKVPAGFRIEDMKP